ncbi:MAG: hypothetical protein BGO67_04280 [Alphaproteobacteria bacterium 41-28]|nr:MAG: hypothetical protein BGO67_04280 [Alphaproteobacteria bacterium 41-28]
MKIPYLMIMAVYTFLSTDAFSTGWMQEEANFEPTKKQIKQLKKNLPVIVLQNFEGFEPNEYKIKFNVEVEEEAELSSKLVVRDFAYCTNKFSRLLLELKYENVINYTNASGKKFAIKLSNPQLIERNGDLIKTLETNND